jgi:3-oxoadipate enol-lactonase
MAVESISINGAQLQVEDSGGATPLVLIHGLTLDHRMWDANYDALSQAFRTIRLDMRGFGGSSGIVGPYSHSDDLLALLDAKGIEQAVIVGKSAGGRWAIDFALAYPERVRALVLADSSISGWPWKSFVQSWKPIQEAAASGDVRRARDLWCAHPLFAPLHEQPSVAKHFRMIVDDYSMWHFANIDTNRVAQPLAAARIGELTMPMLVLIGERDLPDFQDISNALACAPHAQKVVEKGVGHMANMEAAEYFNRAVIEFVDSL